MKKIIDSKKNAKYCIDIRLFELIRYYLDRLVFNIMTIIIILRLLILLDTYSVVKLRSLAILSRKELLTSSTKSYNYSRYASDISFLKS